MALSKLTWGASLCRALSRSADTGRTFTLRKWDAFHQPAYARTCINNTRIQTLSTSICFHNRHFVRKNSAVYPKLKESACRSSTGENGTSKIKPESKGKSGDKDSKPEPDTDAAVKETPEENLGIIQRFKLAYKQHGKILIGVHLATSSVWFGSFWYLVHNGVDVVSFLEKLGVSERILSPVKNSGAGDIALAYLLYKLATPARYTVTLGGTNYMIRYLRKVGKMEPQTEKMRDLMRDSSKHLRDSGKALSKPKKHEPRVTSLQNTLRKIQAKSKTRVQKMRGKSQRRLVQLRRFIRSKAKKNHNGGGYKS